MTGLVARRLRRAAGAGPRPGVLTLRGETAPSSIPADHGHVARPLPVLHPRRLDLRPDDRHLPRRRRIVDALVEGTRTYAPILVLFFAISQFLAYFKWTNIGNVIAIEGAQTLKDCDLGGWTVLVGIAVLITFMNLVITSGSALWALAAPVLVPMLMLIGIEPETTQAVYRVADSVTNCVTPMSPYFVMALGFIQQHRSPPASAPWPPSRSRSPLSSGSSGSRSSWPGTCSASPRRRRPRSPASGRRRPLPYEKEDHDRIARCRRLTARAQEVSTEIVGDILALVRQETSSYDLPGSRPAWTSCANWPSSGSGSRTTSTATRAASAGTP